MQCHLQAARLLSSFGLLCLAATTACADVRFTTQSVMDFSQVKDSRNPAGQKEGLSQTRFSTTTVTALKGAWERIEMTKLLSLPATGAGKGRAKAALMQQTAVKIVRWDTNEEYLLFPQSKVYTRLAPDDALDAKRSYTGSSDISKMTGQRQDLPDETLQNVSARHCRVTLTDTVSRKKKALPTNSGLRPQTWPIRIRSIPRGWTLQWRSSSHHCFYASSLFRAAERSLC